jgi:hypothetical protein
MNCSPWRRHSPPSIGGRRLSDPEVPTNLAQLSVKGAGLAIALVSVHGVIAQEFVDASLVGSGIGDTGTGIYRVGVGWWNAEGCQCYGCCRRRAQYCPLHQVNPCLGHSTIPRIEWPERPGGRDEREPDRPRPRLIVDRVAPALLGGGPSTCHGTRDRHRGPGRSLRPRSVRARDGDGWTGALGL